MNNGSVAALLQRRSLLKLGLGLGASAFVGRFSFAGPAAAGSQARFVFIIMRGALDGLSAMPPYGDPDYARLRGELAIAAPGANDGALRLDATFGLNPGLQFLHECYDTQQLIALHAVATAYRERSHFDGQDVLENGLTQPHAADSGWLNRALSFLPAATSATHERGVALAPNVPLVLRGPAAVASWSPSVLPDLDADTMQRIVDRYASDPVLSQRLAAAMDTDELVARVRADAKTVAADATSDAGNPGADAAAASQPMAAAQRSTPGRYLQTVQSAAGFLRREDGPSVAVFDTTGWDTHFNEGGGQGQLRNRLATLDQSLRVLKDGLGDTWQHTVVLLATEFGRTAASNGTRGTDHGTGSAAFLLGGAVAGGRVIADWPGLSRGALYQQRDLKPTTDLRSVLKSVLHDHLQIPKVALDGQVFPDSRTAPYLPGLVHA